MKSVALCLLWFIAVRSSADFTTASLRPQYAPLRPQLRASAVPVLLPMTIPNGLGKIRSIAVIAAGPSGYYVGFSPLTHCAGALSCAFFHVAGYPATSRAERPDGHARPVRLWDGTRADYFPSDCSGASCTEASLIFERRGTLYELDAKVAPDSLAVLASAYRDLGIVR